MKLSLTSVYTQQKSYQTSNQLKTIFELNLNTNKFKYKHLDNFSHTMSHKATNLPISMGCWPVTDYRVSTIKKSINFQEMTVSRANNSEKRKKTEKTRGNENFEGNDKCLSTKLARRKHLKEENLKRKLESFSSWSIKLKFYQAKITNNRCRIKILMKNFCLKQFLKNRQLSEKWECYLQ